ncbi:MAG: hypothetical protein ACRDT4_00055 [Micromonosporaceae bacterium]
MTEKLPSRWDGIEELVPERLEDLHGPAHGTLTLPVDICWSGRRQFDLANYKHRLTAYRIVLTAGCREDAEQYLDARHLIDDWPDQRRLLGPHYRRAWESRFPELVQPHRSEAQ